MNEMGNSTFLEDTREALVTSSLPSFSKLEFRIICKFKYVKDVAIRDVCAHKYFKVV